MKQNNHFGTAFSEAFKKCSLHPILLLLWSLLVCAYPLDIYLTAVGYRNAGKLQELEAMRTGSYFVICENSFLVTGFFLLGLGSICMSMAVRSFRFCHDRTAVNVYYSMGIRRKTLYEARALNGFISLPAALLPGFALCAVFNIGAFGYDVRILYSCFLYWLVCAAVALTAFAVPSLSLCASGTTLEGTVYGGIFLCIPFAIDQCILYFLRIFLLGNADETILSLWGGTESYSLSTDRLCFFDYFAPVYGDSFLSGLQISTWYLEKTDGTVTAESPVWVFPDWKYCALYISVAVVCFFVGRTLFVHRKSENAGIPGTAKPLLCVASWTVSLMMSSYATYLVAASYALSVPVRLAVFAACAVLFVGLFYGIPDILGTRSLKKSIHTAGYGVAVLTGLLLFCVCCAGGMQSREKYIPSADAIESVGITLSAGLPFPDGANCEAEWDNYLYDENGAYANTESIVRKSILLSSEGWSPEKVLDGITEPELIETVRTVHAQMLAAEKKTKSTVDSAGFSRGTLIHYTLKNGREIYRRYQTENVATKKMCYTVLQSSAAIESTAREMEQEESKFGTVGVAGTGLTAVAYHRNWQKKVDALFDAVATDIRAGNMPLSDENTEVPMGYLVFDNVRVVTDTDEETIRIILRDNAGCHSEIRPVSVDVQSGTETFSASSLFPLDRPEESGMSVSDYNTMALPVYESMTATLSLTDELGMTAWMTDTQTPTEAWCFDNPVADGDFEIENDRFQPSRTLIFAGRTGMKEGNLFVEMFPKDEPVAKEDIPALWEKVRYTAYLGNAGRIVLFGFADGTYSIGFVRE